VKKRPRVPFYVFCKTETRGHNRGGLDLNKRLRLHKRVDDGRAPGLVRETFRRVDAYADECDGVTFESPSPFRVLGLKVAFLVDPAGTRIELTEGLAER
jgi:hypothetical protein